MGHANPSITANAYAHLLKERRPEAAVRTDEFLFGAPAPEQHRLPSNRRQQRGVLRNGEHARFRLRTCTNESQNAPTRHTEPQSTTDRCDREAPGNRTPHQYLADCISGIEDRQKAEYASGIRHRPIVPAIRTRRIEVDTPPRSGWLRSAESARG